MTLESRENCAQLLRCPRTHAPLIDQPGGLAPRLTGDPFYPIVGGVPILVDFERSVLDREAVSRTAWDSPVKRAKRRGLGAFVKQVISPPKRATKANVERLRNELQGRSERPRILVVGGGTIGQGMAPLYDDPDVRLIAFDIYCSPNIHFVGDAHAIPIADEAVDAVVIQAVLEHVLQPDQVVAEIWRVLKPGGLVYAETPFLQHVHEGAYDFTRFTESGHRYLFRKFTLLRSGVIGGPATQLLWSLDYFGRSLFRSVKIGKAIKLAFIWLNYVDRIIPEKYASDAASGVYFLGEKADVEITPLDAVGFYRGAQ